MAKTLDDIKRDFFEKPHTFDPVSATYWGLTQYDDKLRPFDGSVRNEERSFYTGILADLETYRDDLLAAEDRMDVTIMRRAALWTLLWIEKPIPLGWRSSVDISDLVGTVYQNISRQQGKPEEWNAILSRMRRIPDVLASRKKNLEIGLSEKAPFYKREVLRDGIELRNEIVSYFKKDVLDSARQSLTADAFKKLGSQLESAASGIEDAVDQYVQFLKSKILPAAKDDVFGVGEEHYLWRLRNLLLSPETPESLFEYAKDQVAITEKQMQEVADTIQRKRGQPKKPYAGVIKDLQQDAPATDKEMFAMYQELLDRTVLFIEKKKLFRLPAEYTMLLKETPAAYTNVLSIAAMNPIPPFRDGIPGQFWVTPTHDEKHPNGNPELLRQNHCRSAAPNLVVHEAVPGHDLQLGAAARRFISGGRKDLSYMVRLRVPDVMYSLGVEGWAHYTEQLMAEQGFYTPEERIFQLKDAQWRNVRIVVDVGIHTGRMTYDEAVRYFNDKTVSGEVTAEREIYRYSKWPLQAITYHLGKRDILSVREETRTAVGEKHFDLAEFHELLLDYDGIPVTFYREDLLEKVKARMTPSLERRRAPLRKRGR